MNCLELWISCHLEGYSKTDKLLWLWWSMLLRKRWQLVSDLLLLSSVFCLCLLAWTMVYTSLAGMEKDQGKEVNMEKSQQKISFVEGELPLNPCILASLPILSLSYCLYCIALVVMTVHEKGMIQLVSDLLLLLGQSADFCYQFLLM